MKTFYSILVLLLVGLVTHAQGPTPWILSGNTPFATDFLGSINNARLNFATYDTQRMTIDTTGFVGIGNFSTGFTPAHLLHLHQIGNAEVWQQFSNDKTGDSTRAGFQIGLN